MWKGERKEEKAALTEQWDARGQKQQKDVRQGSASGPEALEQEADGGREGKGEKGLGRLFLGILTSAGAT